MESKLTDEIFFERYKSRWEKINFIKMIDRKNGIFEIQCNTCKKIFEINRQQVYHLAATIGVCNSCHTLNSKTPISNNELSINRNDIFSFLNAIYSGNLNFFKTSGIIGQFLAIEKSGKISKKQLKLLFNNFFGTNYSTKKLLFNFRLIHPTLCDDTKAIGDSSGNLYYPLMNYIPHRKLMGRNNNETEVILKRLMGEEEFKQLLEDKLSTILSERYAEKIVETDFKD